MLKIVDLITGYGKKEIIHEVSLEVKEKEIVSLIGPNGAGKSTLLKAVFGLLPINEGQILYNGRNIKNIIVEQKVYEVLA